MNFFKKYYKYLILIILIFIYINLNNENKNSFEFNKNLNLNFKQVWILYYGYWGNIKINNQNFNWKKKSINIENEKLDISSKLFPKFGIYSSHDIFIIKEHLKYIKYCGIDAIILIWDGHNSTNLNNPNSFTDITLDLLFNYSIEFNIKIGIQIQHYPFISNVSLNNDINYYLNKYVNHSSILKINNKPVIIIYEVKNILNYFNIISNFESKVFLITTINYLSQIGSLIEDGFKGIFSYFLSEKINPISSMSNWNTLHEECNERGILFIPTVGPGYNDEFVNDWFKNVEISRESGKFYEKMWNLIFNLNISITIINSFNNWLESTSIEPSINRNDFLHNDETWSINKSNSNFYLDLTKQFINLYKNIN